MHAQGTASEHSYRPALTKLFASVDPNIKVQNEPKKLTDVGAPDFSFSTDNAAIGHCEAKTLGHDLLKRQGYEKDQTRRINFDPKLWKQLQAKAKHKRFGVPDEVQTFDYIYGVLHCPAYRDTYKEFLKIDFPRIPWPATADEFWHVSAKGQALRGLHLMQDDAVGDCPYPFMGDGDNTVEKPTYEDGKVWINKGQYFDGVPDVSWGFYIGGYQPAQKWLKDRKGRALSFDDIMHYQKIIKILAQTDQIMRTIEMKL